MAAARKPKRDPRAPGVSTRARNILWDFAFRAAQVDDDAFALKATGIRLADIKHRPTVNDCHAEDVAVLKEIVKDATLAWRDPETYYGDDDGAALRVDVSFDEHGRRA